VYVDAFGVFWARPFIRGRRTWRKLKAVKAKAAVKENALTDWNAPAGAFAELAQLYLDAGCPNRRLEARPASFAYREEPKVKHLMAFFGQVPAASIRLADIPKYRAWRLRKVARGSGERTVDLDTAALSNVMSYGVATGQLEMNYIRSGRPRYRRAADVRHSRTVAPADASVIHRLADELLSSVRSEVLGWQLLFAMFTGCRTSELLRLRLDADGPHAAGFYQDGHLFLGARSKHGVNPWAIVGPEFAECIDCFTRWHRKRFASSPWYFPSPKKRGHAVDANALGHALARSCRSLELPHITPHGLRSFYVTKRRSDGVADTVIAGEIGDQTVSLLQTTYGARPANWTGGAALSWLPAQGLPAWQRWEAEERKIVSL
jgi:integrase